MPAGPVVAMAASGCANPIISVLGAGHASRDAQVALADLIAPERSRRWIDDRLGAVLDLGQVSWIVQVDDVGDLDATLLNAAHLVRLEWPDPADEELHMAAVLAEAAADVDFLCETAPAIVPVVLQAMRRTLSEQSTGTLYGTAASLLTRARLDE